MPDSRISILDDKDEYYEQLNQPELFVPVKGLSPDSPSYTTKWSDIPEAE